ncbi:hypothetical protein, partial [Hydrogenibacillus schlegelii]|uniref:hypothetical protein n=1 Tax=Hydrogenibacillus schlegelii TaxID=1484 RepID=UPI0034A0524E
RRQRNRNGVFSPRSLQPKAVRSDVKALLFPGDRPKMLLWLEIRRPHFLVTVFPVLPVAGDGLKVLFTTA